MRSLTDLRVKIYADGADLPSLLALYSKPYVHGFTTNPTLMHKAGIRDYRAFAAQVVEAIPDRPVSFEVFSDEFPEMERQAREIASWGRNVFVKIPVTNTRRESSSELVRRLAGDGISLNVTALMTLRQVEDVTESLRDGAPGYVSVFAGRVADTGQDPVPVMAQAVQIVGRVPGTQLIWASPRELFNVFQADAVGCHIITVTPEILRKISMIGYDPDELSLDTVKMFYDDARKAGYVL